VKTQAGVRTFPIHPLLLELGFAEYIEELRGSEHDRVLHGIPLGNRKAGDQAGKWWNERYREKHLLGFKEQRKTLYSFRHTFVTHALNEPGIELALVQQIVGHEKSQMGATEHYDKGATMPRLFEQLSRVDFELPPIKRL
jgi:integrase